MRLAERVLSIKPSPTLAITAKAQELREQGHDVIGLGIGEPDFNTPNFINDAAKMAMDKGFTKYTPVGGIPELKQAIADKLAHDNNIEYDLNEIVVTTGAKYALHCLFQVLLNKGDEVIIPTPYWVSYPDQVQLAGGQPVWIEGKEENNFKITPEQLKASITQKTKALVINSPSNPTGMMYTMEELEAIGAICVEHNIIIISDEIYEKLIYTSDEHISIASISESLRNITIVINGVSKSHAMTGWRIGYAAGPYSIIRAMTDYASHSTSNPTSIAQYAALAAYTDPNSEVVIQEMKQQFAKRLNIFYNLICDIPGITCNKPHGAFYIFPNAIKAAKMNGFATVGEWVSALLEKEKVALVPGSGFGAPNN